MLTLLLALVRFARGRSFASLLSGALLTGMAEAALIAAAGLVSVVLRVSSLYEKGDRTDFIVHYAVDQAGIHAKSSRGDTDLGWKQVTLTKKTRRAVYLLEGESRAVMIPKGLIENEDERNTSHPGGKNDPVGRWPMHIRRMIQPPDSELILF